MTDTSKSPASRSTQQLVRFIESEALPGTAVTADAVLDRALPALVARFAPRNRELLAFRDELQMQDRRLAPRAWRRSRAIPRATRRSSARSAISCPSRPTSRSRPTGLDPEITDDLRPAARRAGQQRALRAQRRQCPLGQPLRCALRHRRDPARRATSRRARASTPRARAAVVARAAEFLDEAFPLAKGSHRDVTAYKVVEYAGRRDASSSTPRRGPTTLKDRDQFAGYREDGGRGRRAAAPQRPPCRSS